MNEGEASVSQSAQEAEGRARRPTKGEGGAPAGPSASSSNGGAGELLELQRRTSRTSTLVPAGALVRAALVAEGGGTTADRGAGREPSTTDAARRARSRFAAVWSLRFSRLAARAAADASCWLSTC